MSLAHLARLALLALAVPALVAATPLSDDAVRLPAVVVEAEARSIITVQVPVPELLRDLPEVTWVVKPLNGASIVGMLNGALTLPRGISRSLVLTIRIPSDVRAGPLDYERQVEVGRPRGVQRHEAPVGAVDMLRRLAARHYFGGGKDVCTDRFRNLKLPADSAQSTIQRIGWIGNRPHPWRTKVTCATSMPRPRNPPSLYMR